MVSFSWQSLIPGLCSSKLSRSQKLPQALTKKNKTTPPSCACHLYSQLSYVSDLIIVVLRSFPVSQWLGQKYEIGNLTSSLGCIFGNVLNPDRLLFPLLSIKLPSRDKTSGAGD